MEQEKQFGYIQVTRTCNQKCLFCSNPYVEDTLTIEEAKKQIDYYVDECKVNEIVLSGGEPTLNANLAGMIRYVLKKGAFPRIITNGQKLADISYVKNLADSGLQQIMVSIYSHDKDIHDKLTDTPGSYENVLIALDNLSRLIDDININITLNSLNINTLPVTVKFLIEKFPKIRHIVFNNLDPTNRALENTWTIPRLVDIELPLIYALKYLKKNNISFRVERVPLCYMNGFEEFSTETRRIVKNQAYRCLFLDKSGRRLFEKTEQFYYPNGKSEACEKCKLTSVCAGLNERYAKINGYSELYPVFDYPDSIIRKISENSF